MAAIVDRRDHLPLTDLVEELELARPDLVAEFERRHPEAMQAVADEDLDGVDGELLDDLAGDLRELLRV